MDEFDALRGIDPETVVSLARYQEFLPLLEAGLRAGDLKRVREIAAEIENDQPGNAVTHWYTAHADLSDGDIAHVAVNMDSVGIGPGADDERKSLIEHVAWATMFSANQARAMSRGVPAMIIASQPKSASASVSYFLSEHLDCLVARCSFPGNMGAVVVPAWAKALGHGGAVTHEHFPASADNLAALAKAGVSRIAVQVRDPRQAFVSLIHHTLKDRRERGLAGGEPPGSNLDAAAEEFLQDHYVAMIRWVSEWVAACVEQPHGIEVHFLTYDRFLADKLGCFSDLLSFFGAPEAVSGLKDRIDKKDASGEWLNLRAADPEEWRRRFSQDTHRVLAELLPDELARRFSWDSR